MILCSRLPIAPARRSAAGRDTGYLVLWPHKALAFAVAAMAALVSGCFEAEIPAPSATVSPMTPYMRPAKAADCPLQVLHTMPPSDIQQLALVDTWGDQTATDADLLPVLKRKACEVGADAVVITSDKSQHEGEQLSGYDASVGSNVGGHGAPANVSERMHDPNVGELGHGGHYMTGVAIAFTKSGQTTTSSAGQ
jgi:hypothetical protein